MELASRDVISRAEQIEIIAGRGIDGGVLLDLRHLGAARLFERLLGTPSWRVFAGFDPMHEPFRCARAPTTTWAASTSTWTATRPLEASSQPANAAGVSVHGANRLGGNALMETITYGKRSGRARGRVGAREHPARRPARVGAPPTPSASFRSCSVAGRASGRTAPPRRDGLDDARELRSLPTRGPDARLQGEIIGGLEERYERVVVEDTGAVFNTDLTQALELGFLLQLAACMVEAGIARKESRGRPCAP